MIGAQKFGAFRLLEQLGTSELSETFLAHRGSTRKPLVLKRMHRELSASKFHLGRFLREAHRSSLVDHPNLAHVFSAGREGEHYYLTMEYIEGLPLSSLLRLPRPIPVGVGCRVGVELLDALHATHQAKMVLDGQLCQTRCDISWDKIRLTLQGGVKILSSSLIPINAGPAQLKDQVRTELFSVSSLIQDLLQTGGPHRAPPALRKLLNDASHQSSARALQQQLELFLMQSDSNCTKGHLAALARDLHTRAHQR